MLAFVLRRVLQTVAVLGVVALIAFALFNYTGDPIAFMLGQDATLEDRARLRAELGLDQPFYVQFGHFVGNALQGDFGVSLRQGRKLHWRVLMNCGRVRGMRLKETVEDGVLRFSVVQGSSL